MQSQGQLQTSPPLADVWFEDEPRLRVDAPILVVDDNAETRLALVALFGVRGYRTMTAANGAQALQCLRTSPVTPALVLLDLHMPVMDGRTFLRMKLADPDVSDVPVVVYSAVDGSGLPPDVPYVRKGSHSPDQLLAEVERAIRKS
jgi:CheY-like chemotaxis protein